MPALMEWREWQGCDSGDAGIDRSFRERTPFWSASCQYVADTLDTLRLSKRHAQHLFGRGRITNCKACTSGVAASPAWTPFGRRGRKPAEFHLPRLLEDIRAVVQDHVQTDPTFQTTRQYCSLTAKVRRQLLSCQGSDGRRDSPRGDYREKKSSTPSGFRLRKVAKCRPPKKGGLRRTCAGSGSGSFRRAFSSLLGALGA